MRDVILYMSMSLDGFVDSDREHPGTAIPEGAQLKQWKFDRISRAVPTSWAASTTPRRPGPTTTSRAATSQPRSPQSRPCPARTSSCGVGGGRFAGALAAADLIDEYRLLVQPLVLGQGRALFERLPGSRYPELVEALAFPSGVALHIYRPQHS